MVCVTEALSSNKGDKKGEIYCDWSSIHLKMAFLSSFCTSIKLANIRACLDLIKFVGKKLLFQKFSPKAFD